MSIQALRESVAAASKAANHMLAEKGSAIWSKEDQTKFDNIADDIERGKRQIEAHQRMIAEDREANFDDVSNHNVNENAKNGKQLSVEQAAFNTFLRKSFKDMSVEEALSVRNTMSTTTGSQGGHTVQSSVASQLIDAMKSYGALRKVAGSLVTQDGAPLSFPTSDGTSETGEWIAQNTTATAADPTFGTVALNVFKVSSKIIAVPFELLQDSNIDIQAMIFKRMADRIGRTTSAGFTTGGGTTDPFGLITQSGVGKTGATGQTLTVTYDDLVDLIDSLDVDYLEGTNRPAFMFNQTTRRGIRKIKDTQGRPIWTPAYEEGMTAGTPDLLLGYPVVINNDIAVPAANAKTIAFGDFSKYMIRDAMDVTMFRFDDSAYAKLGQVGFLAWARTGGNLLDTNAVKLYQQSAT